MKQANYSSMTNDEFDTILTELVSQMTAIEILSYGVIKSILQEELNDKILEKWEIANPNRAFPLLK